MANLSKKARVGALISAIWLLLTGSFFIAQSKPFSSTSELIAEFLLFGLSPVVIGWFIRWIRQADH